MAKYTYKGITFAEGWNGTFEQFQKEFGNVHVFKGLLPKDKLAKMKEVFNGLVNHNKATAKQAETESKAAEKEASK